MVINTERLQLRPWKEDDLAPFSLLNSDARVMEYFPAKLTREESDQIAKRMQAKIEERGFGFWAVSLIDTGKFIGFIGLNSLDALTFPVHFAPCVEIGWRLSFEFWGKGYAKEGAEACLQYGFETLNLDEIVSFTAVRNARSRSVMERIGMHRDPKDDFDHPKLSKGHPLERHVLYRLLREEWRP